MKATLAGLLLALSSLALATGSPRAEPDFNRLIEWMTGSFSSREQAEADSAYFDIHLHMVPVWQDNPDGVWLYVEQAASWSLDKPYRQRVYHVKPEGPRHFRSDVFEMEFPLRFAGEWQKDVPLADLDPDSLSLREGCSILLEAQGERFVGSTHEADCQSSLRGASYATSEVVITAKGLESWDRGFDGSGKQVWGAEKGAYIFLREDNSGGEFSSP